MIGGLMKREPRNTRTKKSPASIGPFEDRQSNRDIPRLLMIFAISSHHFEILTGEICVRRKENELATDHELQKLQCRADDETNFGTNLRYSTLILRPPAGIVISGDQC